jgi:hypothetical protein
MEELRSNFTMGRRVVVAVLIALLSMALCLGVAGYTAGATTVDSWVRVFSG